MPSEPDRDEKATMTSLRVAYFTDADRFAGTERNILDLAREMKRRGYEVSIICPPATLLAERACKEAVPFIPLNVSPACSRLIDRAVIQQIETLFRSRALDIIHVHNGRCALLSALAIRAAGNGRCVLSQQFIDPAHTARRGMSALVYRAAHRWVNSQIDHFIAISGAVREAMRLRKEGPDEKITLIPHGIPPPDVTRLTAPEVVRAGLSIPPFAPMLVCASRLTAEKDVDVLVRAMVQVIQKYPNAHAVLAGDGALQSEIAQLIRHLRLEENVHLLGFRPDVLSIIQAGDIFVLPSRAEPFGIVVIEAMALGRPVIAMEAGGPVEIVAQGETGLLTPPLQAEPLANAILSLLANPQQARQMGQRGRARYEERFTVERMVDETMQVYQKVLCAR